MRSIDETRKKWDTLFSDQAIGLDLRQAVKEPEGFKPCEDGLRSICWKAFLLYGPLSQSSWPKKLADSRSAYASLRSHFLRFIEHPDDLESSVDPLADDTNSPWASLRQDEINRAEIFQDVERCLQENFFFREPSTQKMLLDILFIYSKLHPDTGYRQGMHELLAPILWVVHKDAINKQMISGKAKHDEEGEQLMCTALDAGYIEHDAFALFCAVMQTTKSFYELGETNVSSPIVARCAKIHDELLSKIDPDLADHLQEIEVLPQIFLIRWIRLLFGREFAFEDVLSIWDLLFAENLNLGLIDTTCIAMLLRIRWQLMEADYSTALTLLLRYPAPTQPFGPATLVQDAIHLDREQSPHAGAILVGRYTGRRPEVDVHPDSPRQQRPRRNTKANLHRYNISNASQESLGRASKSPARFQQYQKGLETAFQEVSGNLQKRTEGWNLTKTVRGAVGEIRKNVNSIQSGASSPRRSVDAFREPVISHVGVTPGIEDVTKRVNYLEDRNKALAKMLADALEELRFSQADESSEKSASADSLNIALAKIQFVQVYLEDSEIPIPPSIEVKEEIQEKIDVAVDPLAEDAKEAAKAQEESVTPKSLVSTPQPKGETMQPTEPIPAEPSTEKHKMVDTAPAAKPQPRPALAQSSFSWILGEEHHRSSFISAVSVPPEERRGSDAKDRPKKLFAEGKKEEGRRESDSSGDAGFTMRSLRGKPSGTQLS